jgi:hypothetical protein
MYKSGVVVAPNYNATIITTKNKEIIIGSLITKHSQILTKHLQSTYKTLKNKKPPKHRGLSIGRHP